MEYNFVTLHYDDLSLPMDDAFVIEESSLDDKENDLKDWFHSIMDRDSDEESIRQSTVEWLKAIEKIKCGEEKRRRRIRNDGGKEMEGDEELEEEEEDMNEWNAEHFCRIVSKICSKEKRFVVNELSMLICGEFYDVFCVRNVLKIINETIQLMISSSLSCLLVMKDLISLSSRIQQVKQRWCDKALFRMSPNCAFEFDRSQQIVRCCDSCLHSIDVASKFL